MNMNQKGLAPIIIILIVVGIVAIGGGIYWWQKSAPKENLPAPTFTAPTAPISPTLTPTPTPTITSTPTPTPTPTSTEKASGIIKSVYSKSGKNYIDIDYIELNPNWAPGGMSGPAYQNNNPKIRTFEISPSAKFVEGGRSVTFSEFQKFFITSDIPAYQKYNPWDIVVTDGVVVEITEHYLP